MTQIATVERILDDTHAEISVPRKSACGHDCEECAGCGVSGVSVYAKALNTVGARPGQKVVVESDTKKMLQDRQLCLPDPGGAVSGGIPDHAGLQHQRGGAVYRGGGRSRAGNFAGHLV